MTDADRKRAFDICTGDYLACEDDCPYAKHGFSILGCLREHRKYMRDEINRQKAEIFNLNKEISALNLKNNEFLKSNEKAKAEIERLQTASEEAVSCFTRMESLYKIKCKELEVAKSEAYREFAAHCYKKAFDRFYVSIDEIVEIEKELSEQIKLNTATNQSVSLIDGHIEG